jgi:SARP family transcriptional regulator, regulator of embCAB operon
MSRSASSTGETTGIGAALDERDGRVEVGLIGHFRVASAGRRHELTHSQARLLALLCLRPGDVGREWLAGQLWDDVSTATALRRLRSTMSRLHHSIPGIIRRGRDSVGLSTAVRVDLGEARDRARRLVDGGAEQTAALWSPEPFLDDLLVDWYDEWIDADRNEFRNLRIHALEVIARHLIATDQFASAIESCLVVLRTEPFRETTHALIVQSHLAEGNRTEAIAHARSYDALVRSELGMEPDVAWAFDAR